MSALKNALLSLGAAGVVASGYWLLIHDPHGIHKAKPGQFDWQVYVSGAGFKRCGGVVVKEGWVLTAAHCVYDSWDRQVNAYVLAGVKALDADAELIPTSYNEIKIHPGYKKPLKSTTLVDNDIALVYFPDLKLGQSTVVIDRGSLTDENRTEAHVAGWACNSNLAALFSKLVESYDCDSSMVHTKVPVQTRDFCDTKYCKDRFMCAGGSGHDLPGVDTEDSGSGLTTQIEGSSRLIGIVNHSRPIGDPYARVSQYADWIDKTLSGQQYPYTPNEDCKPQTK